MGGFLTVKDFNKKDFVFDNPNDSEKELKLKSLDEFHKLILEVFYKHLDNYIWRGQEKEEYKLIPSLYRYEEKLKGITEKNIFESFKEKLKKLPPNPNFVFDELKKDNDTIWAIGQHYGLLTPLLDWTKVPYISLYFAFMKKSDGQDYRVVYALNKSEVNRRIIKGKNEKKDTIYIKRVFIPNSKFLSPIQNTRLIVQRGCFTRHIKGEGIAGSVKKVSNNKNKAILIKILIPDNLRIDCLSLLESMNITHGNLFPDYSGAVEISLKDLGLDNLKCC